MINKILIEYTGIPKIKARLKLIQKAKMVHAVEFIGDYVLHNILEVNKLRNLYAHSRKPDEKKVEKIKINFKFDPRMRSKGMDLLEILFIQTMFHLNKAYEKVKEENTNH